MIRIVVGDLLSAEENIIAHQVNCKGKFGSGIALQIKNKYPSAYKDYMKCFSNGNSKGLLGKVVSSKLSNDKYIVHLFGQLNYGYDGKRYTSYDALYDSLTCLKEQAKKSNKSIAIPYKLGSDRGGASWEIVYKMIDEIFSDYEVTIYKLEEN